MAKGDGGLQQLGRNRWRVTVSMGKDPVSGKRRRATQVVNGTKAEARKVRDRLRSDIEGGLRLDASKVTLAEFVQTWAEARTIAGKASANTVRRDVDNMRHVLDRLGSFPLGKVTPQMVESAYAAVKEKFGLSGTTMHKARVSLKNVFKKACDYDLVMRNPCDRVEAPKVDDPKRSALEASEAARLLRCLDEAEAREYAELAGKEARQLQRGKAFGRESVKGVSSIGNIIGARIALATGMRMGEVLGLSWAGVDAACGLLRITQAVGVCNDLKEPKTSAGVRTVAVDGETMAHIEQWKARQAAELAKIGVRQADETPVCCSNVGGFNDRNNFGRWWRGFREANGFPGLKFHELRHTQATLLLANGVDVKTVQARMGHANASITLNWYAHAVPENDAKAAAVVGALLSQEEKPKVLDLKTA